MRDTVRSLWIDRHFPGEESAVHELVDAYFRREGFAAAAAERLVQVARAEETSWGLRCLAALLLEGHALELDPAEPAAWLPLLRGLGLLAPDAEPPALRGVVLEDGFTTTELRGFVRQLRAKLARAAPFHRRLREPAAADALDALLQRAGQPCRLPLARYLLAPERVVHELRRQLRITAGRVDRSSCDRGLAHQEARRQRADLPAYEAEILSALLPEARVAWARNETPARILGLVEHPLTTVVLVLKLPGSQEEFEIKRAGVKGPQPLTVVFERDGHWLPESHRLWGGSMSSSLRWEASASALLGKVWLHAHGREAPASRVLGRSIIEGAPGTGGEVPLAEYLSDPQAFGPGFEAMRAGLGKTIETISAQRGIVPPGPEDVAGRTKTFLLQVLPAQALLANTSSFRLDTLADYLSAGGAERYFAGLERPCQLAEALRFADDLLDEALAEAVRPAGTFASYGDYLAAAFAQPDNRRRADACFVSLLEELGEMFGTVLAMGGGSRGESFVARNVGLRSRWTHGRWRVGMHFMDHDSLDFPGQGPGRFRPRTFLHRARLDEFYALGNEHRPGEVGYLEQIYRVGPEAARRGREALRAAMAAGYRRTRRAMLEDPAVGRLYERHFLPDVRRWDGALGVFLEHSQESFPQPVLAHLRAAGFDQTEAIDYVQALRESGQFVRRYAQVFAPQPVRQR